MELDPGALAAGMEWDGHGRWRLAGPIARRRPEARGSVSFAVTVLACGFARGMGEGEARRAGPSLVRLTAQDPLDPTNGVAFEGRADTFDGAVAWACGRAAPISSWADALSEGGVEEW